jgi:cobalt-precorrin 5A hydrolase
MRIAGIGFRTGATPGALAVTGVAVAGVATPTQAPRVQALYGTGSVAEAAALVGAGPGARLVTPRQVIGGVTIAVAEGRNDA